MAMTTSSSISVKARIVRIGAPFFLQKPSRSRTPSIALPLCLTSGFESNAILRSGPVILRNATSTARVQKKGPSAVDARSPHSRLT